MSLSSREQAIQNGEIKYVGKPCKRCGGTVRYTRNAGCVNCEITRAIERQQRLRASFLSTKKEVKEGKQVTMRIRLNITEKEKDDLVRVAKSLNYFSVGEYLLALARAFIKVQRNDG